MGKKAIHFGAGNIGEFNCPSPGPYLIANQ